MRQQPHKTGPAETRIQAAAAAALPRAQAKPRQSMSSINPAKKRKAARELPHEHGNDDPSTVVPANASLSLADLDRLIDQRVTDAVGARILELSSRVDGLQRENEGLLRRCESLERSVQVLKRDGNWTYSVPAVPRSHWIDQGHDEEYADEAESLIQTIEESAQGLRSAYNYEVEVGGRTSIFCDTALDPHWEQLVNAIQLSERIKVLNLWNVQLDERTLQMIEASARQKGITRFDLNGNSFRGGEGVKFAIDVLKSNRSIETFGWEDNSFQGNEDACKLIDAVLEHPTICDVGFTGALNEGINLYTPVKRLFGGVGADKLLEVSLSGNGIKTDGDRCISDFLSTNPSLKTLDLEGNRLNDDDALHIALALQSNTNLRLLDFEKNKLTANGKSAAYCQAVFGCNPSDLPAYLKSVSGVNLNTVSEANHTCEIAGVSKEKSFMNCRNKSAKSNRSRKMFLVLRKRHRQGCSITQLESEFSGNCMGLVPHVLACVSTYSSTYSGESFKQKCLSVIFELVRGWKIPEMYQFRR